jgi:hypothetical protein
MMRNGKEEKLLQTQHQILLFNLCKKINTAMQTTKVNSILLSHSLINKVAILSALSHVAVNIT